MQKDFFLAFILPIHCDLCQPLRPYFGPPGIQLLEEFMSGTAYRYGMVVTMVMKRERGEVQIRLVTPSGSVQDIWIDDSRIAPLSEEQAVELVKQWGIALPD